MTELALSQQSLTQRLRDPLLVAGIGIVGVGALHFRDPHESTWLLCPFKTMTGLPCPGCGGLRAINLLSNGEILAAASSNLLAVALVPILIVAWAVWLVRRIRGAEETRMIVLSNRMVYVATALIAVFWIARLTPWGSWLAP